MTAGYGGAAGAQEQMTSARPAVFPPVVYVPCEPVHDASSELVVDLRRTRDGRMALLVYSALDRLVDCCGAQQPWTLVAAAKLEDIRLSTGFDLLLMDVDIPEEFRYPAEVAR